MEATRSPYDGKWRVWALLQGTGWVVLGVSKKLKLACEEATGWLDDGLCRPSV